MAGDTKFNLGDRTFDFASSIRIFVRDSPRDLCNFADLKQLTRSSGSVGANYIEANEGFSKKDFYRRLKICHKEAKESLYWLKLIHLHGNKNLELKRQELMKESEELIKTFSSIINKGS